MWINLISLFSIMSAYQSASSLVPSIDAMSQILPGVCFTLSEQDVAVADNQVITCTLAVPGEYPPLKASFSQRFKRCCFYGVVQDGLFWAVGEASMSKTMAFQHDRNAVWNQNEVFHLKEAKLVDILALDAQTDEPVQDARVTMADDAVHLISHTRRTDEDGYVVLPMIEGESYVITIRADGYLAPLPMTLMGIDDGEYTIELDPGLSISGKVVDEFGKPVANARLHAEVTRPDRSVWSSDIDLPRPISDLTQGAGYQPYRGSYTTDNNGRFKLETLPAGKIRLFASHDTYAPSSWVEFEAEDSSDLANPELVLNSGLHAYLRVEDAYHVAVPSSVTISDADTLFEMNVVSTTSSGALELRNLPHHANFAVYNENFAPVLTTRTVNDGDEITIVLDQNRADIMRFHVVDENREPVENVTISPADAAVQKKYPTCLAKTDSHGDAVLEMCPQEFWADVYHPEFSQVVHYASQDNVSQIVLSSGQSFDIRMVDEKTDDPLPDVTCSIDIVFNHAEKSHKLNTSLVATDGILKMTHRPESGHHMTCTAGPDQVVSVRFDPDNPPEKIAFPHLLTRDAIVLDAFSGTIPYARIQIGKRRLETDESGRITISALPGARLEVRHWQHGTTHVEFVEGASEFEIRLPDKPDEHVLKCLDAHQLKYVVDSAEILLDQSDKKSGFQRGDSVENCTDDRLVVVRDGRRIEIKK